MKILKYGVGIVLLLLILVVAYVRLAVHEPRPEIIQDGNAQALSEKMLKAVNKSAWDTLPLIQWSFRGVNHYIWDKINNKALIKWDDITVHLDPDMVSGKAYKGSELLKDKEAAEAIQKAWSNWCNDMFWLAAPYKIKDPGVVLNVAKDIENREGLLVSYESGGVTPGDSYLWFLDDSGMPTGYKMWVKIIPIGGIYTSWEQWKNVMGGTKISSFHQGTMDFLKIEVTNIKGGMNWQDLGYEESPIKL